MQNAPKCSNRKYWNSLKLLDCRDVTTNKGMFDSCIQHLGKAVSSVLNTDKNNTLLLHTNVFKLIFNAIFNADVAWFIGSIHYRF